jgi:hypothetical protein
MNSNTSKFSTLRGDSELERYIRWKQDFVSRLDRGGAAGEVDRLIDEDEEVRVSGDDDDDELDEYRGR